MALAEILLAWATQEEQIFVYTQSDNNVVLQSSCHIILTVTILQKAEL